MLDSYFLSNKPQGYKSVKSVSDVDNNNKWTQKANI